MGLLGTFRIRRKCVSASPYAVSETPVGLVGFFEAVIGQLAWRGFEPWILRSTGWGLSGWKISLALGELTVESRGFRWILESGVSDWLEWMFLTQWLCCAFT